MKKLLFVALAALSLDGWAQTDATVENRQPPPKIDVAALPKQAQMIDEVVVPVPSEIFSVLDKIGQPHWNDVLRKTKGPVRPMGGQAQISLLLGTVIAEGFIAVEAEDTEEVKKIGSSVLNLASAINVRKAVLERSKAIIDGADKKNWTQVRRELDKAQNDVRLAMDELQSQALSHLVSLGGWLRGTEALTAVVNKTYTKDGAELLHQPVLVDYFDKRLSGMEARLQKDPLVVKVRQGLLEIRPLMGVAENVEISEKTAKEIGQVSERLIKAIQSKSN